MSLGYIYSKRKMEHDLKQLQSTLSNSLPWLPVVLRNGSSFDEKVLSNLDLLSSLTRKDRKSLSMELKNSWTLIESIRESFKMLVEDFMNSNSARIRLGTFTK